jgi:hypothetical protein
MFLKFGYCITEQPLFKMFLSFLSLCKINVFDLYFNILYVFTYI